MVVGGGGGHCKLGGYAPQLLFSSKVTSGSLILRPIVMLLLIQPN